jgi:hypothetical protein
MKHSLILVVVALFLAGNASARLGERLDPRKLGLADVNGKQADLPTLDTKTLSYPVVPQGRASASRERFQSSRGKVETTNVEVTALEFDQVPVETRSQPRANFSAKRPVNTRRQVTTSTVKSPAAEISTYRITTGSAEGQAELKRQLNRRP